MGVGRSWVAGINIHRIPAFFKGWGVFRRPGHTILVVRPLVSSSSFPLVPRFLLIVLEKVPRFPILLRRSAPATGPTELRVVNQEAGFPDEVVVVFGE